MSLNVEHIREVVGERFHRPPAPTLVALERARRVPIVVSYVESEEAMPDRTLAPPRESGFAIHVHHRPLHRAETWIDGKHARLPGVGTGGVCMFDLRTGPVAQIHESFSFTRFYLARATLDDLAHDHGMPRVGELRVPEFGHADPVIEHLALALRARGLTLGTEVDSLFADGIALAFHSHIVSRYGVTAPPREARGGLTPRQLRLVTDWMTAHLAEPMSIADIAAQLDMAPHYFARVFRQATGEPPHRWIVHRRIARAKELLLRGELGIAEVARLCGFADQSHLTRAFTRHERTTPASWRRRQRS